MNKEKGRMPVTRSQLTAAPAIQFGLFVVSGLSSQRHQLGKLRTTQHAVLALSMGVLSLLARAQEPETPQGAKHPVNSPAQPTHKPKHPAHHPTPPHAGVKNTQGSSGTHNKSTKLPLSPEVPSQSIPAVAQAPAATPEPGLQENAALSNPRLALTAPATSTLAQTSATHGPSAYGALAFGSPLLSSSMRDTVGDDPSWSTNNSGNMSTADSIVLEMEQAFKRGDVRALVQRLPLVSKHPLEPWAAYWTLRARLDEASVQEVKDFLSKYAGTYVEDRLRNDWLLLLGSRRDWTTFADQYPLFRMRDDRELQCYGLMVQWTEAMPAAKAELEPLMKTLWLKQKDADDGCTQVVERLFDAKRVSPLEIWQKAWWAGFNNKLRMTRDLVKIAHSDDLNALKNLWAQPVRYLKDQWAAPSKAPQELVVLALARVASMDPAQMGELLQMRWGPYLTSQERHWLWGAAGVQAALRFDSEAIHYFEHVSSDNDLNDEMLIWWTRLALRTSPTPHWRRVEQLIAAMPDDLRKDPAWIYWGAKAQLNLHASNPKAKALALAQLESIASVRGFYEQLAMEDLGRKITLPPKPTPPSSQEINWVNAHPGLKRALYAINLGLQSQGAKEWNYTTTLVNDQGAAGRMSDTELLASAMLACKKEVFDRCIYSAEKSLVLWDADYLFPTPFKELVVPASQSNAIDPAFVYGLIRQESRFVKNVRSVVGASGLMQVMPKTAIWTAKKIGLKPFTPDQLKDKAVNVSIGTGYMGLVLQSLDGAPALAAAAYNAGPSRARKWREVGNADGAAWVENIPFSETRDYVKKVLSNTTVYAAVLTGQAQSLKAHLNGIAPSAHATLTPQDAELP